MLDEFNGLPAHPLIVHIPVVFVPLALLGALVALGRPRWRSWLLPLVAGAAGISTVAAQLAVISGRNLKEVVGPSDLIAKHEDLALQSRPLIALFFVAAIAALVVDRRREGEAPPARMASLVLPLCVLSVLTGALATTWVARTGDAGSKATWQGEIGYDQRKAESKDGGSTDGSTTTTTAKGGEPAGGDVEVSIADFAFAPKEIEVKVGSKVTWTNADSARHNAKTQGGQPTDFTTKDLAKGDSDSVTFDEAGEYSYVCGFHTYMTGRIMVSE